MSFDQISVDHRRGDPAAGEWEICFDEQCCSGDLGSRVLGIVAHWAMIGDELQNKTL
eukprot:m.55464 g.55464  ORF g.55464 m.55464 type:complete len:57 (-) comp15543_c0_seq2:1266-1436(-)